MTAMDQAALRFYQRTKHHPRALQERLLDAYFAAPESERISLEEYAAQQEAVATVMGETA